MPAARKVDAVALRAERARLRKRLQALRRLAADCQLRIQAVEAKLGPAEGFGRPRRHGRVTG